MAVFSDLVPANIIHTLLISQQATYNAAHMSLSYIKFKLKLVQDLLVCEVLLCPWWALTYEWHWWTTEFKWSLRLFFDL